MDKAIIWDVATRNIPELLAFCDKIIERDCVENHDDGDNKNCEINI